MASALLAAGLGWAAPAGAAGAARVVSLAPVATEIVLALGRGERLVAVDARSARIPGLEGLPVADGAAAGRFSPDLVLAPAAEEEAVRRAAPGAAVLAVAPHDFDEAWALCRSIGAALGREEEALRWVREVSRPLALVGAASFGKRRPRVVALLGVEPLEIAGGHNFVTDLVELAGGENVTHGSEEPRLSWTAEQVLRSEPELAVLAVPADQVPRATAFVRERLGPGLPVEPLAIDPERFWLRGAVPAVEALRARLDALRAGPSPH